MALANVFDINRYCPEGDIDTIQADDNDVLPTENDVAMVDCSIGNDSSTEEPEAEGILDIQGDTCFGMVSTYLGRHGKLLDVAGHRK